MRARVLAVISPQPVAQVDPASRYASAAHGCELHEANAYVAARSAVCPELHDAGELRLCEDPNVPELLLTLHDRSVNALVVRKYHAR